ncbi:PREDICTED: uncharacterized protein LOC104598419 [Nelumbo nucifera]|uniref:Uncharacterized protein LOC104598419 n=1 Tax=Nelumbo nucifera TaxID=4432 RepID=A0A1U7ZY54_NELNU|nr:PREDICTED: uncharacterized protein LOC104598419 [Nelumbo nucifera]
MAEEIGELNIHNCSNSIVNSFDSQIPGSSYSLSLPSEPPDIRNWFSSYVYESPGSINEDFSYEGIGSQKDKGFAFEETSGGKENGLGKFKKRDEGVSVVGEGGWKCLNGFAECRRLVRNDEQENQSANKGNHLVESTTGLLFSEIGEDEKLSDQQVHAHNFGERARFKGGDSLQRLQGILEEEHSLLLSNINKSSSINHGKSSRDLLERRYSKEESLGAKVSTEQLGYISSEANVNERGISGASTKESNPTSSDKENQGTYIANDGFISTRKNRSTRQIDGNSMKRKQEVNVECSRTVSMASPVGGDHSEAGRKPLSERTNFQSEAVTGIVGKWRCPQERKSNLGPPLKQLRLEQWVHRV